MSRRLDAQGGQRAAKEKALRFSIDETHERINNANDWQLARAAEIRGDSTLAVSRLFERLPTFAPCVRLARDKRVDKCVAEVMYETGDLHVSRTHLFARNSLAGARRVVYS